MTFRFDSIAKDTDGEPVRVVTVSFDASEDRSGGVLLEATVWRDSCHKQERLPVPGKPGLYADGERYRSELMKPARMRVRIDLGGLAVLAVKAARSKSGRAKSGPVTVTGKGSFARKPLGEVRG